MALSPDSLSKSSLEELLENLRIREEERPKNLPPTLPSRPRSTSARLPSVKRLLPIGLDSHGNVNKGKAKKTRNSSFGSFKVKDFDGSESPYVVYVENAELEVRGEGSGDVQLSYSTSCKEPKGGNCEVDHNVGYFFRKKLRGWCQLENGKWGSGQIQSTSGDKASVLLSDGSVVTVLTADLSPANPDILEGVDDLIQLSYLNEPSVLHNLEHRYSRDMIYSKAGHVLIAINPFKDVQLYGNEFITAYKQKLVDSPHVYFIADAAYTEMMSDELNQSIIISGESGSGKTETAKIAMQYLAGLAGGSNGIEFEILHTNSILEAFGNAKTFTNDNSSRFGKIIEIHFSVSGKICGAKLQTFLLEKSRVVQLAQGERSYHIFYQLCAGAPSNLRDKLKLRKANDYYYLNQSNCLTIPDVNDATRFHKLVAALSLVKISKDDQEHVYEMLAAVLWLGNISFHVINNENHIEVVDDEPINNAASLLGCSSQDLMLALSTHRIQAGKEKVSKRLTLQQTMDARDALAKCLYESLFNWLVEKINISFAVGQTHTGRSISILDIYGFESHKENSFEQLCINYANERLQQHFNRHLFKLEQEEYELDGVDWTKVDFVDNQECLDLFEKKPIGLISLLDEESRFPKATDLTFANKIKQYLDANPCFKGVKDGVFGVLHSAGEVLYDTSGFLEKNRDSLHSDTIQLLSLCRGRLPQAFASKLLNQSLKQSVGTKFKGQLFKLMQQLETTKPHFIRCIKPNNQHIPSLYDNSIVLEQLRWCGVLEVVRIARSGYPTRITHQEFTRRYGFLLPDDGSCQDPLTTSVSILQQFNILPEMYQVGYTKLYFRVGQIGNLQELRKQLLQGTLEVQKCFRAHRARRYFHELRGGVTILQSFIRGEIDRRQREVLLNLKEQDACKKLDDQLRAVIQIQSGLRGRLARKHCDRLRSSRRLVHNIQITRKICEVKDLPPEMLPSIVEELQRRIVMAEATCSQKEKENAGLRGQVQQFEARWSEYEAKMKNMENIWLKQMSALQTNLAAAKKSLAAEAFTGQPERGDGSSHSPFYNSSEDSMSLGNTPRGSTPILYGYTGRLDDRAGRETNDGFNELSHLAKEFEERKQTFDDATLRIVKTGRSTSANPIDEFRQLKHQFEAWKKDYRVRLKEAKSRLHKHGNQEGEKVTRKWWGKKTKKLLLHSVQ